MAEPIDLIVPMLREMRPDAERKHAEIVSRLDRLEMAQLSFKQALSADALLSKLVTGEFEERIEALERKVMELERQR